MSVCRDIPVAWFLFMLYFVAGHVVMLRVERRQRIDDVYDENVGSQYY